MPEKLSVRLAKRLARAYPIISGLAGGNWQHREDVDATCGTCEKCLAIDYMRRYYGVVGINAEE